MALSDRNAEIIEELFERLSRTRAAREQRWNDCAEIARRNQDGVSAWEALSANGYVPESWLTASRRWFTIPSQFYRRKRALEWVDPSLVQTVTFGAGYLVRAAHGPIDRSWAALLASMAPTVIEVEALAIEAITRARTLWVSSKPRIIAPTPVSTVVWTQRGSDRAPSVACIDAVRATSWYFTVYGTRASSMPTLPKRVEAAIVDRIGRATEWNVATIIDALASRGARQASLGRIVGNFLTSRVFRALREVASNEPIALTDSPYVKDIIVPAREDVVDPFDPYCGVLERGCEIVLEMGQGITLSTPIAPSIEPPKKKRA